MAVDDLKRKNEKIRSFLIDLRSICQRFRFWMNISGRAQNRSVSGLNTDVFRDEMYSRTFETLDD